MPFFEIDADEFTLRPGEVLRTTSLTVLRGPTRPVGLQENIRETYKTKKGYRFVLLLLGTEKDPEPMNLDAALEGIGLVPREK
jgi:hypothetical protein